MNPFYKEKQFSRSHLEQVLKKYLPQRERKEVVVKPRIEPDHKRIWWEVK